MSCNNDIIAYPIWRLSSPLSSKLSISCSNFSRRNRRFEYRSMRDEVLLELGRSFNTASNVVFSSSTFAFALLISRVSDLKFCRWSNADCKKPILLLKLCSAILSLFNAYLQIWLYLRVLTNMTDERSGLLHSGISFIDSEHLRGIGHLAVVWVVTMTSSRILYEDWVVHCHLNCQFRVQISLDVTEDLNIVPWEMKCCWNLDVLLTRHQMLFSARQRLLLLYWLAGWVIWSSVADQMQIVRNQSCFSNCALQFWVCLTRT